ncbi:MAG TPA: uroporphyrinogen decarboxylase family protein [Anaerolineae bacterium]|nr:uroporphyrinogen decarboxylase family protein [Anaerolineae bacterium]
MNGKERVIATLNHQPTDRTPLDCWLYQKQFVEKLAAEYGSREQFLDEFGIDIFVGFVPYPNQFGRRFEVSELATLRLDDPGEAKWIAFKDWNPDFAGVSVSEAVEQQGDRRAIIAHTWGIVEGTSTFLGIEECWANLGLEPDLMMAWFDRYADWLCGLVDSLATAGGDIFTLSDDWGSNQTMLFSPRMWRRMIKPYTARVVAHARARGLYVNLHSDGYILNIMDDIIELGYHALHPVQESAGMDPRTIKQDYGDKLVIYGSLDVVDGLYKYEGEALDRYIAERFAVYAPGGGFIFNTGHFVQPDIPPARLVQAYTLARTLAGQYGS